MLTKVEIENFQSHKLTVIEFVPGTNVIIGKSDAGKSAVFRAINWVCSNRPLGDAFRSEWGGQTRVSLYTKEGDLIERIRDNDTNSYLLNGIELKSFGSEVPEKILEVLKVDSANIQGQMDPPFLLSATPGEAAKMLNKAASIDEIDHTITGLKKSHNSINNEIRINKNQEAEYDEQMKQYENLPIIEDKLGQTEKLEDKQKEKIKNIQYLQRSIRIANDIEIKLKETENIPGLLKKLQQVEKLYLSYKDKTAWHERLSTLTDRIQELQIEFDTTEHINKALPLVKEAKIQFDNWRGRKADLVKLERLTQHVQRTNNRIKKTQETINSIEEQFHEIAPEFCPLCGSEWRGEKI